MTTQRLEVTVRQPSKIYSFIRQPDRVSGVFSLGVIRVGSPIIVLTQREYDAITQKDSGTLYFIRG